MSPLNGVKTEALFFRYKRVALKASVFPTCLLDTRSSDEFLAHWEGCEGPGKIASGSFIDYIQTRI